MYTPYETVKGNLDANMTEDGESVFRIVLGDKDAAWSPDEWNETFYGPARVSYRRLRPDGPIYVILTIEKQTRN